MLEGNTGEPTGAGRAEEKQEYIRTHKSGEGYREENKGVNGGGVMVVYEKIIIIPSRNVTVLVAYEQRRLQREGRTENRANKNALYSKTCKEEMRERRKASRTENRGRKG